LVWDLLPNFHTNLVLVLGHKADFWLACGTCSPDIIMVGIASGHASRVGSLMNGSFVGNK